jgi:hypothetical protein
MGSKLLCFANCLTKTNDLFGVKNEEVNHRLTSVGAARFELTISWSQTKRDTGLRYAPIFNEGAKIGKHLHQTTFVIPAGIEPATCCLEGSCSIQLSYETLFCCAERGGFEPPVQFNPYDSLANCWFQPLTHLSVGFSEKEVQI